jgi:hypothetical protein
MLGELKLANGDITIIPAAPGFDLVSTDEGRLYFTPIVAWQFEEGKQFNAPNGKYFHLALPVTIEDGTVTEGMVVRYPSGQLVALHDVRLDTEKEALEYLRRKERERRGSGRGLRAA